MTTPTPTGRPEPALILGLVGAVLSVFVALKFHMTSDQAALIVAAITAVFGVVMAFRTRPIAPALFTTAVSSLAALFAGFGFHVAPALVGAVSGVILALAALLGVRHQVTAIGRGPL